MFCAAVFLFQRHQRTFKRAFEHSESLICNSANENSNVNPTHCGTSLKIFEREAILSLLVCRISFQILSGIKDTYRRDGSTPLGVVWESSATSHQKFFCAGLLRAQERKGHADHRDVVMPAEPMPALKVIQAQFLLEFAIILFDPPAAPGYPSQTVQPDRFGIQIAQPIVRRFRGVRRPLDQQPLGDPRGILQPFLGKDRAANSADNWPAPRSSTNSSPPAQDCNISEFGCAELRTDAGDQN